MSESFIRDLGEGLIIRRSTSEDAQALAEFNIQIHSEDEWDAKGLENWTLDLISGEAPTFNTDDFLIVEDTRSGEIISSSCLISQTWSYEGIPFRVGRPELFGTRKEFRRRGLVRQQMEILHEWSAARGELVQAITGIPFYYRQFGYEMALNLHGGRSGYKVHVPKLEDGEEELYTFREATTADIPFLMATYNRGCQRSMVYAVWNKHLWLYELTGKHRHNINARDIFIIEDPAEEPVGFIGIPPVKWGDNSVLTVYELVPGVAWPSVTPGVARFLWKQGETLAESQGLPQERFGFMLGETHPAYDVIASCLPFNHKPYAYYMRVPDLLAFIQEMTPALEARLADTPFEYYTGEVKLGFYRDGIRLVFKNGHLEAINKIDLEALGDATARFPGLTFLQLLFGYRNMDELGHAYADCFASKEENKNLINTLFPKRSSDIWPIS
ncbi:MAG: GNAT family N-acetyltransferase [Anaerolineaceae bacterium]